jgi:hypothetical protein
MFSLKQAGVALLLVTLTVWLQCGGVAALVPWIRRSVAGDIHKLGPFHTAALGRAIDNTDGRSALVRDSVVGGLLSVGLLLVLGLCVLLFGKQLHDRWLWRCDPAIEVAHVGPPREHDGGVDVRNIGKSSVCHRHAAHRQRGVILLQAQRKLLQARAELRNAQTAPQQGLVQMRRRAEAGVVVPNVWQVSAPVTSKLTTDTERLTRSLHGTDTACRHRLMISLYWYAVSVLGSALSS